MGNNNKNNNTDNPGGNQGRSSHETVTCSTCKATIFKFTKHCYGGCGKHHYGDVCWYCEPDRAPDDWKGKEKAIADKKEREKNKTSTTGPLHQQSGNANPSTADEKKKNKSVFFSTNLLALPHFHKGPQRS